METLYWSIFTMIGKQCCYHCEKRSDGPVIFSPSPVFGCKNVVLSPNVSICPALTRPQASQSLANRAKNHTLNVPIPRGGKNYRPVAPLLAMTFSSRAGRLPAGVELAMTGLAIPVSLKAL
jgi:hypothetical protein